jgi:hypothetical protein
MFLNSFISYNTLTDHGMKLRLWIATTNGHIVHPPDDI